MAKPSALVGLRRIERDVRLDLFRGAGLWMIFLDHIPHDV
ncbi:OpgC domain-containing protein, partial [Acinetobacter baumannii]